MFLTLNAFISMTFREAIRNKILYGIGVFAIAIFLFSLVLGELSLYEQERVIRDVGMTFMMLMGIALAMYTGIGQIHREIDRRIIYTILSKPVRRYQIVIGKFLGIAVTLFVEMFAMFAIFLALLAIRGMVIDPTLFEAFWLSYMESLVVAAAALMFSTFSSAMLSTLMCTGFVLLASLYPQIGLYAEREKAAEISAAMHAAQFLLPNFGHFDVSTQVSYALEIPLSHVGWSTLHGLTYIVVLISIAAIVMEKRDFV